MRGMGTGGALRGALRSVVVSAMMAGVLAGAGSALALDVGGDHTGYVTLMDRQVPLPEGRWVVAGVGDDRVVKGDPGAYGAIESAVLFRTAADGRVDAVAEINTNAIAVNNGWGTTKECKREDALARVTLYRTVTDNMCFFVKRTEASESVGAEDPKAWVAARAWATAQGITLPSAWLTAGLRASDRRDVLEVRYHFDLTGRPGADDLGVAEAWAVERVAADGAKRQLVGDLNAWAGLTAAYVEKGLRGKLADHLKGQALGSPFESTELAANGSYGAGGSTARLAALRKMVDAGALSPEDYEAYANAIKAEPPPQTLDDYYQTLVRKTFSYNFFRVSVDYLLAYIVTVDPTVSGYITAAIVATHSVAQIFNDIYWDSYIARTRRDGSEEVEFRYIGAPAASLVVADRT